MSADTVQSHSERLGKLPGQELTQLLDACAEKFKDGAGAPAEPGIAMPMASETQAMVLAVNWPPQAPAEGQATRSSARNSSSEFWPA